MRLNVKRIIGIISLLSLAIVTHGFEKVGVTAFQFLKVTPDARAAALGDAYSALARGADGMYWNPAAMLIGERFSANLSLVNYIFDTRHSSLAIAYQHRQFALGLMALNVNYGEIEVTDVAHLGFLPDGSYNPGLTGEVITPGALVLGAGFAQRLTNKFTYGIAGKYAREDFCLGDTTQKALVIWDFGIHYATGFRSVRLAATLRNFGPQVKYFDYVYPLPQTLQIGLAANLFGEEALVFVNKSHQLLLAVDLIQPRDYDQQYGIGAEYLFNNFLVLRIGYKLNFDTENISGGVGLRLKNLAFDYAYNTYGKYLAGVHRFSINFNY